MFANLRIPSAFVASVFTAVASMTSSASAISVEVAKKCDALAAKAFPPIAPGNPASGSSKGTAQDQRAYFNKCVANGGNMDDNASKDGK
jgi:hypothetical protein